MALTTIVRGRVWNFSHAVGRSQVRPPGFSYPVHVAAGKGGVVYVLNRSQHTFFNPHVGKIRIGAPGEEEYLRQIGGPGSGDGQFLWPTCVALDREENLYVADEYLQRISLFDGVGKFLGQWGKPGSGPGELNGPSGLAFDGEDNLYVVDSRNHRVQKFTKEGVFLGGWGHYGQGEGEFHLPWGIAVDAAGEVYVADWKNHRVQKMSPEGAFLAQFGRPAAGAGDLHYPASYPTNEPFAHLRRLGSDPGALNHPSHVAVDGDGDVYVSDWGNDRVQVYTREGEFITSLLGESRQLSKWAQEQVDANPDVAKARRRARYPEQEWSFRMPAGIAVDPDTNRVIVVDTFRRRLQIYIKEKAYVEPQLNL